MNEVPGLECIYLCFPCSANSILSHCIPGAPPGNSGHGSFDETAFSVFSDKEDRTSISELSLETSVRWLSKFAITLTVGITFLLLWNEVPQI